MKLRVIDRDKGLVTLDLPRLPKSKKKFKMREVKPPPLWHPRLKGHDPEGRNER